MTFLFLFCLLFLFVLNKQKYTTDNKVYAQFNQKEYFFLCKYVGGEFGTGDGPEYNNDPKYIDSGKFIPEIIKKEDVKTLLLLPTEIRDKFVEDIEKGNL